MHNVKAVVLLDIRKPINEIADTVGMIHGTVYNIVTNNYEKNEKGARWVSHLMTEENKCSHFKTVHFERKGSILKAHHH